MQLMPERVAEGGLPAEPVHGEVEHDVRWEFSKLNAGCRPPTPNSEAA